MRRTLQSELPEDMFWDEDPAHVAIELETLAVSSWLALKQGSAMSYSDDGGRRHSDYHVKNTERSQRDQHNRFQIVGQTLRVEPVSCFLARAFFHCSLDEEELREMGHLTQNEEADGNDEGNVLHFCSSFFGW